MKQELSILWHKYQMREHLKPTLEVKKNLHATLGPFETLFKLYINNNNNNNNTCMIKCRTPTNLLTWNTRVWHVSIVRFRLVHKLYAIIIHSKKISIRRFYFVGISISWQLLLSRKVFSRKMVLLKVGLFIYFEPIPDFRLPPLFVDPTRDYNGPIWNKNHYSLFELKTCFYIFVWLFDFYILERDSPEWKKRKGCWPSFVNLWTRKLEELN